VGLRSGEQYTGQLTQAEALWLGGGSNYAYDVTYGIKRLRIEGLLDAGLRREDRGHVAKEHKNFWTRARQLARNHSQKDDQRTLSGNAGPSYNEIQKYKHWTTLEEPDDQSKTRTWLGQITAPAMRMGIPITPLECMVPELGKAGMCLPGIGEDTYQRAGQALKEVLEYTISKTDKHRLGMQLSHVDDGWEFLHYVLLYVARLTDTSVPPSTPQPSADPFELANRYETYRIERKLKGYKITKHACSIEYLRAVTGVHYATARSQLAVLRMDLRNWKNAGEQNNEHNYRLPREHEIHDLAMFLVKETPGHANMPIATRGRWHQREYRPDAPGPDAPGENYYRGGPGTLWQPPQLDYLDPDEEQLDIIQQYGDHHQELPEVILR